MSIIYIKSPKLSLSQRGKTLNNHMLLLWQTPIECNQCGKPLVITYTGRWRCLQKDFPRAPSHLKRTSQSCKTHHQKQSSSPLTHTKWNMELVHAWTNVTHPKKKNLYSPLCNKTIKIPGSLQFCLNVKFIQNRETTQMKMNNHYKSKWTCNEYGI